MKKHLQIDQVMSELGRMYSNGIKPFFSVTTIINKMFPTEPFLIKWWQTNPSIETNRVLKAKGCMGTIVHDVLDKMKQDLSFVVDYDYMETMILQNMAPFYIEYYNGLDDAVTTAMKYIESYIAWGESYTPIIIGSEVRLYHEQYDWAGTTDDVLKINNEVVISDIKTGSMNDKHFYQGVAYAMLWNALYPQNKASSVAVLYLKSDFKTQPTYKFKILDLKSAKGNAIANEWLKLMELFRLRYANADGTYPFKPRYRPKDQLRLNGITQNLIVK